VGDSLFDDTGFLRTSRYGQGIVHAFFCVPNCQTQHENYATNALWQTLGSQKNQQEPTHFLPTQRKNTTFAMQNNEIKHTNNEIKIFLSIIATE
jgi:hypothetical protein